jgi:hypothetical protein
MMSHTKIGNGAERVATFAAGPASTVGIRREVTSR